MFLIFIDFFHKFAKTDLCIFPIALMANHGTKHGVWLGQRRLSFLNKTGLLQNAQFPAQFLALIQLMLKRNCGRSQTDVKRGNFSQKRSPSSLCGRRILQHGIICLDKTHNLFSFQSFLDMWQGFLGLINLANWNTLLSLFLQIERRFVNSVDRFRNVHHRLRTLYCFLFSIDIEDHCEKFALRMRGLHLIQISLTFIFENKSVLLVEWSLHSGRDHLRFMSLMISFDSNLILDQLLKRNNWLHSLLLQREITLINL